MIRGFFVVIVAVLLFFSVFSLNLFGILSSSLTYENVQQQAEIILKDALMDLNVTSIIEQRYPMIVAFCVNNSEVVIGSEYIFSNEGIVFDIPCESALQGIDTVVDEGIRSVVHRIYYGNYSENITSYLDTPQDAPLFLISEKAQIFSKNTFYYSLLASLILIGLLFLLTERKSNTFLLPGIFMVLSSLIFFKINDILALFSDGMLSKFLGIFFSTSFEVSVIILIAGVLLILVAVFFKIFRIGFWISSLVQKFKGKSTPVQTSKKKNK